MSGLQWSEAIAAILSSASWVGSAIINVPLSGSFYGGPPEKIKELARRQYWLNAGGAGFAAVTAIIHAVSLLISK